MSQQKVDYHKEQKRNRRQIMKKEKAMRRLEITILVVVLAALLIWFCYLVYRNAQAKYAASGANTVTMNLAEWENYTGNLGTLINGEEAGEEVTEETAVTEGSAEEETEAPAEETEESPAEETEEAPAEEEPAEEDAEETADSSAE